MPGLKLKSGSHKGAESVSSIHLSLKQDIYVLLTIASVGVNICVRYYLFISFWLHFIALELDRHKTFTDSMRTEFAHL